MERFRIEQAGESRIRIEAEFAPEDLPAVMRRIREALEAGDHPAVPPRGVFPVEAAGQHYVEVRDFYRIACGSGEDGRERAVRTAAAFNDRASSPERPNAVAFVFAEHWFVLLADDFRIACGEGADGRVRAEMVAAAVNRHLLTGD